MSLVRGVVIVTVLTCTCACSTSGGPVYVLQPVDINKRAFVPSARVSWNPEASDDRRAASFTGGVEFQYSRGRVQSDQTLGSLDYISYGGQSLFGPQDVRHFADLRYGHLAYNAVIRFRRVSRLELEVVAGIAQADLHLRSESQVSGGGALAQKYAFTGIAVGVGPRWNFTNELAVEGRLLFASNRPFSLLEHGDGYHDYLWYPELAFRYRPAKNVALRAGVSRLQYEPTIPGSTSSVYVVMRGPFVGLDVLF